MFVVVAVYNYDYDDKCDVEEETCERRQGLFEVLRLKKTEEDGLRLQQQQQHRRRDGKRQPLGQARWVDVFAGFVSLLYSYLKLSDYRVQVRGERRAAKQTPIIIPASRSNQTTAELQMSDCRPTRVYSLLPPVRRERERARFAGWRRSRSIMLADLSASVFTVACVHFLANWC